MIETGVLFTVCRYVLDTVCVTIVWIDFISDFAQEYKWGIVYVCPYVPGLFTGIYDDMTRVYYFCYFISFVSFMMSRDSHPLCSVKLTDQGHELLEWNVRGRCASALRAANVIANKLSPLLQNDDMHDIALVGQYCNDFECKIDNVISCHSEYEQKFAGDLDSLAAFT